MPSMSEADDSSTLSAGEIYTPAVESAILYIGLPSAAVSLVCSLFIIQHVHRSKRERKKNPTFLRLMIGLSICDVISSTANIAMTFADGIDVPGSFGCTSTAFLLVTAFSSAMVYNAGLGSYFTLVVVRQLSKEILKTYYEPIVHFLAIVGAGSFGVAGLFLEVYNPDPASRSCWATGTGGCFGLDDADQCARGGEFGFTWNVVIALIVLVTFVTVSVSSVMLYCNVRQTEKKNDRWMARASRAHTPDSSNTRKSTMVARQGTIFCGGVIAVTIFSAVHMLLPEGMRGSRTQVAFALLDNFFFPLQGFFDAIVYFRPRYTQWRKACPEDGQWFAFRQTISTTLAPSIIHSRSAICLGDLEQRRKSDQPVATETTSGQEKAQGSLGCVTEAVGIEDE